MLDGEKRIIAALAGPTSRSCGAEPDLRGRGHITYYPQLILNAFAWFLPPKPAK